MTESDEIDLAIYVDRIDMDKDSARVNLHWEGTWKKAENRLTITAIQCLPFQMKQSQS